MASAWGAAQFMSCAAEPIRFKIRKKALEQMDTSGVLAAGRGASWPAVPSV